jgi:DEAD/DEAH box helicase domain-containing protein
MKSESIYKRVLVKEILRQAFINVEFMEDSARDNVHGEFGLAADWSIYEPDIRGWLQNPLNKSSIDSVIEILCVATPWTGVGGAAFRTEMRDYLQNKLLSDIKDVVDDPSYTQEALSERLANAGRLPMFGFPTRVRTLYTRWPSGHQWPPESGTVERDLDIAISQFAPRSQIVKDKAVHTSIGVVDFVRRGNQVIPVEGFAPPLSEVNPTSIGRCDNCQAVVLQQSLTPTPSVSTELSAEICLVCKFSPPSLRLLDAREPKGFFTDLLAEDFDGQFEWQPRSTRPSLSIKDPSGISPLVAGNYLVRTFSDHILTLNDSGGRGGFDFQETKVFTKPVSGAYAVSPSPSETSLTKIGPYVSVEGSSHHIALISRRMTDILLVSIDKWPTGIFADPTTVEGRAAWFSLAFWLRIASATQLDVDALELQAGFRSVNGSTHPVIGEAFLCDQLENGAG